VPVLTREEIERLSPTERLELIGQLTDSLDEAHVPLNAAQQAELDRRMETFDQDVAEGVTWEELRATLARRCP
jgi:putative addiction module component (TIGR02574 family)